MNKFFTLTICWKVGSNFWILCFFLVDCLSGWNQWIWLVPYLVGGRGCLTQGPAPNPKCKLIISPFFTLPHLLDCLIFTKYAMSIVLLLQLNGGWARLGGSWFILALGVHLKVFVVVVFYIFVFCCLTFSVPLFRWVEHDGCCACFFVFFLLFVVCGPFK